MSIVRLFYIYSNPKILEVFKKILRSRLLSRYQLEKDEVSEEQLDKALAKLQELGLIERKAANFQDLDKYYPTKEGLSVEKLVK